MANPRECGETCENVLVMLGFSHNNKVAVLIIVPSSTTDKNITDSPSTTYSTYVPTSTLAKKLLHLSYSSPCGRHSHLPGPGDSHWSPPCCRSLFGILLVHNHCVIVRRRFEPVVSQPLHGFCTGEFNSTNGVQWKLLLPGVGVIVG